MFGAVDASLSNHEGKTVTAEGPRPRRWRVVGGQLAVAKKPHTKSTSSMDMGKNNNDERLVLPEHMDRWTRNQRLYETLKGMGLFVSPITEPGGPTKIRQMIVSADLPTAEGAAEPGVDPVLKRPKVGD